MSTNVLEKYCGPVRSVESKSKTFTIKGDNNYNITHTIKIKNDKYRMDIYYSGRKIVYIKVTTEKNLKGHYADMSSGENSTSDAVVYWTDDDKEFVKSGINGFIISANHKEPEVLEKNLIKKILTFFTNRKSLKKIDLSFLNEEESPNKSWLEKHGIYDDVASITLFWEHLREMCLGNEINKDQLMSIMETGELYRDDYEKAKFEQYVSAMQEQLENDAREMQELDKAEREMKGKLQVINEERIKLVAKAAERDAKFIRGGDYK